MRRLYFGLAILAIAVLAPVGARANDRQIAQQIVQRLQEEREKGALTNFSIDLQVKEGAVRLKGHVTRPEHEQLALKIARQVEGVARVYNELELKPSDISGAEKPDNSRETAAEIARLLKQQKDLGNLKDFAVDIEVENGQANLSGRVASPEQLKLVLDLTRKVSGITRVENSIEVTSPAAALTPATKTEATPKSVVAKAEPKLVPAKLAEPAPVERKPALVPVSMEKSPQQETDADALAQEVVRRLQEQKDQGNLKDFAIDIDVDGGVIQLSGNVSSPEQRDLVIDQARHAPGAKKVVDGLAVNSAPPLLDATPYTTQVAAPVVQLAMPVQPYASARHSQMPLAFAPARPINYEQAAPQPVSPSAQPMPMPMPMPAAGAASGPARYDHPQLPAYAWPSYAPYPNYGAVTYPKQYSASAWPYIGPFYPYPQVPLGWRKVTLEWDDGWWQLDFKSH